MSREGIVEALLWTAVFIGVAITIAAGVRVVDWITGGEPGAIWKVALTIVAAGTGGGAAIAKINARRNGDSG